MKKINIDSQSNYSKAVHGWIKRHYGQAGICDDCGTTEAKRFDWHNIDGKYTKDRDKWERLCTLCHRKRHPIPAGEESWQFGKKFTNEHIEKIRQGNIGKSRNAGRRVSKETKLKMRLAKLGNQNARKTA